MKPAAVERPKRPYHKPRVTKLGTVAELTRNMGTVQQTDNPLHTVGKQGAS
jgi:hypothetical protein